MADFLTAYKRTKANEGAYSNDEGDSGGETIWGIARNEDPKWQGWPIVDQYRKKPGFPGNLKDAGLEPLIQDYYRKTYWNPMHGDEILNQDEANAIYDGDVNTGNSQGVILAQRALGITETGHMDDHTLNLLNNKA
jgi:lysozyme family protein